MSRIVFINCVFIIFFLGCQEPQQISLPYYNTPDFTPIFIESKTEYQQKISHRIAPFSMTDQHGLSITDQNIKDKIHIANFMFTRCTSICPRMTNNLKAIQETFKADDDLVMLSFSVTPWLDSVPELQRFSERYEITSKNWHLLTGTTDEIYRLARQSYFAEEALGFTKDSTDFLHTERVLLVDKNKHIRGVYNATLPLEIEQLTQDIFSLKKEADFY